MKTRLSGRFHPLISLCLAAGLLVAPLGMTGAVAATPGAATDDASDHGMAYVVVDLQTGKVLSAHHASERRYPASTTKLMTAYLALDALRRQELALDSPVIMTRRAAAEPPSKMGFPPGSVMRLDIALRMMLVKSANDIAFAIGQTVGKGSVEAFVDEMNETAARLGMRDTHFINPNGLPGGGQYSSPKDLAILASAIRTEYPAFSDYFGTEAITDGKRVMKNGNKLLGQFDGADGMKTGYICASGFNLVSSATRDKRTLIAVVMGANGTIPRERLSANILQKGFETDPASVKQTLASLPTSSGMPLDVSNYICASQGRTDRANERVEEQDRDEKFGSPYLHDMTRAPVAFKVGLGGAAGNAIAPAGVSIIEAYGIPIPTPRPQPPIASVPREISDDADAVTAAIEENGDSGGEGLAEVPVTSLRGTQPEDGLEEQNRQIKDILAQWARKANGEVGSAASDDTSSSR